MSLYLNSRILKFILPLVVMISYGVSIHAQKVTEKNVHVIAGDTAVVDQLTNTSPLVLVSNQPLGCPVHFENNNGNYSTKTIKITSGPNEKGVKSFTVKFTVGTNPVITNYRVYNVHFAKTIVKAKDDIVRWNGTGPLTIDVKANDEFSSPSIIKVNPIGTGSASVVNGNIVYNNTDPKNIEYVHYTLTDSVGTSDLGLVKIEIAPEDPEESTQHKFVVNYHSKKVLSLPDGFNIENDPFHGSLELLDAGNYQYTPSEYFIGQDSFLFKKGDITIAYKAHVIDPEKDPGIVKNDKYYTPKGKAITFDVFANDLATEFPIDTFSPLLTHDTFGVFTYTPPANYRGVKNFFYKINTGSNIETGKIRIEVGNLEPDREILYDYEVVSGKDFVIEYDVPISNYTFEITLDPAHGTALAYVDSTDAMACGTAYGKALISYTPDLGFQGVDTLQMKYCVDGANCITYKLIFNVYNSSNPDCNCIDDCVFEGDLNGDGRVSAEDLLVLGRYMGAEGTARDSSGETIWVGTSSDAWGITNNKGKDLKHADANGDGRLTAADAQAIYDNFGKVSGLVPRENLGIKDIPFELIAVPETVDSGEVQDIFIVLGSEAKPANGIHGISFGLNLGAIDSSSLQVEFFDNTWFTDNAPTMSMYKQISRGEVRIGLTRAEGAGIIGDEVDGVKIGGTSGYGVIGKISIIGDEVDGVRDNSEFLKKIINTNNIKIESSDGSINHLDNYSLEVTQRKNKISLNQENDKYYVYPNPANNSITILGDNIIKIEIYNSNSELVKLIKTENNRQINFNINDILSGAYILKICSNTKTEYRKLIILH